jgi:malate dehydrogenase (oxaloacetate-decarboxylating)(NADP+)
VALISHSNFGSHDSPSAVKLREALKRIRIRAPKLEVEGEMHVDAALNEEIRERLFPDSRLKGRANLFVFPSLDAANTAYNLVRSMTDGVGLGPILMGVSHSAHVLTPSATVRRVVNMSAIAAVEAQIRGGMKG